MFDGDMTTFINMINDPQKINEEKIVDLIFTLCNQKNCSLEYDGLTYCQLSGEIIGERSTIKLDLKLGNYIVVLKEKLQELIQKHCFHNGKFEWSFSKIYNIKILNFMKDTQLSSIDITDDILQQLYSKEEYQSFMTKIDEQTQQISQQPNMNIDATFICPIMKKSYLTFLEGMNIQGQFYSIEGAISILENHREKLFPHQIEYLERIKSTKKQQLIQNDNKFDSIIFKCPQTDKEYYTCLEGIKLQGHLYSTEGLLQILGTLNQDNHSNEIQYLQKIKQFQKK